MTRIIPYDHALKVAATLTTNEALKATLLELRDAILKGGFTQCAGLKPDGQRCRNFLFINDAGRGLTTCFLHRDQEAAP